MIVLSCCCGILVTFLAALHISVDSAAFHAAQNILFALQTTQNFLVAFLAARFACGLIVALPVAQFLLVTLSVAQGYV